jgi:hypothetical protein
MFAAQLAEHGLKLVFCIQQDNIFAHFIIPNKFHKCKLLQSKIFFLTARQGFAEHYERIIPTLESGYISWYRDVLRAGQPGFSYQQCKFVSSPQHPGRLWGLLSFLSNEYRGVSPQR